jgi:hypothetical protein
MYELLSRDTGDPFIEKPTVESFISSNTIYISWSDDECADEYILQRAIDAYNPQFTEIYRGGGKRYTDAGLPDQARYVYRLKKRRGNKTFPESGIVMGVSSLVTRDIYEVNDTEKQAIPLSDTTISANMQYYKGESGLILADEDWYYIDIPPRWRASVVIFDYEKPTNYQHCHFMMYIENETYHAVIHSVPYVFSNYDNTPSRVYFKIYPNDSTYVLYDMPQDHKGGAIIRYTITLAEKAAM